MTTAIFRFNVKISLLILSPLVVVAFSHPIENLSPLFQSLACCIDTFFFFFLIEIYFYLRSNKVCLILFDLSLIKKLFVARML